MRRKHRVGPILHMAYANVDTWLHSPRTLMMIVFTILLTYTEVRLHANAFDKQGLRLYLSEAVYHHMENGCNLVISSILFLIMVSEIPRRISFQSYMLIRSNRRSWLLSQVFYCMTAVFIMLAVITCGIFVFSLGTTEHAWGWSDTTRLAQDQNISIVAVPDYIRLWFTPLTATLYAFVPLALFWFTITQVILFFSILGSPPIGILLCAFCLFDKSLAFTIPFSPTQYATLKGMNPEMYGEGLFESSVIGYATICIALFISMRFIIIRRELIFYAENKL